MSWEIARSLARPSEAFTARHLLDRAGGTLPAERLDDARLIVTELVTNAVRHGATDGPVRLHLRWDGHMLRVEVQSEGAFARSFRRELLGTSNVGQSSGWGLRLVDALADRWGIVGGSETTVWAEVDAGSSGVNGR
jgi:anti-sigma regulatory factor (Ser/Thr protein kinase)